MQQRSDVRDRRPVRRRRQYLPLPLGQGVRPGGERVGGHLDVRLQVEQQRQGAQHHALVLGQQYPDHPAPGSVTTSENPPPEGDETDSVPPAAASRSRSPRSPWPPDPSDGPTPSSLISRRAPRPSKRTPIEQRRALLCRITLVAPSRTAQPNSTSADAGSGVPTSVTVTSIPASVSASRATSSSLANGRARYPGTASRTAVSSVRPRSSISAAAAAARAGSSET